MDLTLFDRFLKKRNVASLARVRQTHVREFLQWLRNSHAPSTVSRKLAAVRGLFKFLEVHRTIDDNPTTFIEAPRLWRRLPQILSLEEVERLLGSVSAKGLWLRDMAILEFLYGTGLRVSELVSLDIDSCNIEAGFIRCVGKGNKERIIPLGRKATAALLRYMKDERASLVEGRTDARALFVNRRGKRLSR